MSTPESSLPAPWVERLWTTMRATYGAAFDRQWECPQGADPAEHVQQLKAVWARSLAALQQNPAAITYALSNLPEHPPNLVQFRSLCNRRPDQPQPALPMPKPDPAKVAEALSRLQRPAGFTPLAWAYDLQQREKAGAALTEAQRAAWREALATSPDIKLEGAFTAPPEDCLPPAMRGEV